MKKKHETQSDANVVSLPARPVKRFFADCGSLKDVLLPFIEGELQRRLTVYQQNADSEYNEDMRTVASRKDGVA